MDMEIRPYGEEKEMFRVGDLVENFRHTARVVEILRETGLNVSQKTAAQWVADPQKTRRVV